MAHTKEKDYEVSEFERDVWICDDCERRVENEDDIHTLVLDPVIQFDGSRSGNDLVWLNKQEGKSEVEKRTSVSGKMEGHICTDCAVEMGLSTGQVARNKAGSILRRLRDELLR